MSAERLFRCLPKPQGSLARFVVHAEQEISLGEGAGGASFPLGVPAFGAPQERAPPAVGGGVVERPEQRLSGFGVVRPGSQLQSGVHGKACGVLQPARVVAKRSASAIGAHAQPEASHTAVEAATAGIHEDAAVHQDSFGLEGRQVTLMN